MRPVAVVPNGGNARQRRRYFRMFKTLCLRAAARCGGAGARVLESNRG